jgi:hypothetical protein
VDKFWTDVEGISEEIRRAGVEKQVIVKTPTDVQSLESVRTHARDLMFMPLVDEKDEVTDWLLEEGINVIGAEVLFKTEASSVISDDYIERMHEKNLLIWANSIVYNERAVISAHHTDDVALTESPEQGWGWLVDKQVDFIQTARACEYCQVIFERTFNRNILFNGVTNLGIWHQAETESYTVRNSECHCDTLDITVGCIFRAETFASHKVRELTHNRALQHERFLLNRAQRCRVVIIDGINFGHTETNAAHTSEISVCATLNFTESKH